MKKTRTQTLTLVAVLFSVTVLFTGVLMAKKAGCPLTSGASCSQKNETIAPAGKCAIDGKCQKAGECQKGKTCSREKCMTEIKTALEDVEVAKKAIAADDKPAALVALAKIEVNLKAVQAMAAKKNCRKCAARKTCPLKSSKPAIRPAVINQTCPLMGSKIDPKKVPDNLYREFKGKGVGFCCGGCPGAWDKLSDAEKQAKLDKATK